MHDQHVFGAEHRSHFAQDALPGGCEYADHLALRVGGVCQRTKQVEYRTHAEFAPDGTGVSHGAVVRLREHEADADFGDAAGDLFRAQGEVDPRCFEHIGAPAGAGHPPVAVLRHVRAGCGRHERRCSGDVEQLGRTAAAGACGIDEVRGDDIHLEADSAHGLGGAGDLRGRLSSRSERHQHTTDLRRRRLSRHDDVEHIPCSLPVEMFAAGQAFEGIAYVHVSTTVSSSSPGQATGRESCATGRVRRGS